VDRICRERYGSRTQAAPLPLRRAGELARLTEQQPENNVQRIVLESLGVTLSRAPGPAPCNCRPGTRRSVAAAVDQQWSLRMQQVLAFESDLLEYDDIFEGSVVIEAKTAELAEAATAELADVEELGGPSGRSTS